MNVHGAQQFKEVLKRKIHAYIKEHCIPVGISIIPIDPIESLWELHIANMLSKVWIHKKAHSFP